MADSTQFFPSESAHPSIPPPRRLTPESKFWRSFKTSELAAGFHLPVTSITFSPSPPHHLAFPSSAAVHLYDGASLSPDSRTSFTSFPDVAYSPSFRCDGALLAAGGVSGTVQVFSAEGSTSSRPIRQLRAHSRPVRVVRYPLVSDKAHLLSAGDDALVTLWDVLSESQLVSIPTAHRDYIRGASASPVAPDVFATGSYDHTVKLWDFRRTSSAGNFVSEFDHGDPVECVLFLPSGGLLATSGGNKIKLWDVVGGRRPIHTAAIHNKTITDLCLARFGEDHEGGLRLLSVSIDGYLKVFDYAAFKVTSSMRYASQLLSVGFSPSGWVRVAGTSNGVVYIGKRRRKKDEVTKLVSEFTGLPLAAPPKPVLGPRNFRYFRRGQSEKPAESDYIVKQPAKVKLAEHDKLLKKFRHKEALVSVLNKKNPVSVMAVMEELVARKKLITCVSNLDVEELGVLLGFLHKYATAPRHARFLMGLAKKVFEVRAEDIVSSNKLRAHVTNLKRMVEEEIMVQRSLLEIQGMVSPLLVIAGR